MEYSSSGPGHNLTAGILIFKKIIQVTDSPCDLPTVSRTKLMAVRPQILGDSVFEDHTICRRAIQIHLHGTNYCRLRRVKFYGDE